MLFTIGHSNLAWEHFAELVRSTDLNVVIDVRSRPASRFAHFNRAQLRLRLNTLGVSYLFEGDRLGGLSAGKAGYGVTARSGLFCDAIDDLVLLSKRGRVALMCSEHDPMCCHRFLLIGRALFERGEGITHILRTGRIETQTEVEERMRSSLKLEFSHPLVDDAAMEEAYRAQALRLGVLP